MTASDFELLEAWRAGDATAADTLVRRHYASVLRFFQLRTASPDDLTQRTFLACVEGQERFRGASSFRAYLFGIARRQLWRYLEDRQRADRMASFNAPSAEARTSMSTVVARREEQRLMLAAMAGLAPDSQLLLGLYYWEGLSAKEIAEVLEIVPSTVTTRMSRARDQLRERVTKLARPGRARTAVLDDLEGWVRSLAADPEAAAIVPPTIPVLARRRS
jgi:RNA polymerase sigma factor (sigma-70 family)